MKAEGIRRGADHVRQFTIIGDGAAWIWGIATAKFPEATQIVDIYHAREHLHALARSLEFILLDHRDKWLAAGLEDLDYGYIDGIEHAVRSYPLEGVKKDEVQGLGYFLSNAPRMRYHWFRHTACSWAPVSSRPAARQSSTAAQAVRHALDYHGADAIIALRCREASSTWEAICNNPGHSDTHSLTSRPP